MGQSLASILVHLIFSTKNRRPLIRPDIREGLSAYLAGALARMESPALLVRAVSDHVHILMGLSKKLAVSEVVEEIKTNSSKWAKREGQVRDFYWQSGYGAFSVSESVAPDVKRYILKQEEHHQSVSFQDEFRAFLDRHGVAYDERYVWD
jgi:REP element-mobilizing transposase RayT